MNQEQRILSALLHNRAAYDDVSGYIDTDEDFSDTAGIIVKYIKEYYDNDEYADYVDKSFLLDQLRDAYPKVYDTFEGAIATLQNVSVPNVISEYRKLKLSRCEQHLAQALLSGNAHDIEQWLEKYSAYKERVEAQDDGDVYVDADIEDVLNPYAAENLIKLHPQSLNDKLDGGVIPGTQIAVYAPTEVGKSLVTIDMCCGFLEQGYRVLYVGNEDPAAAMLQRFYANLSGMERSQMQINPALARQRAIDAGFGNLVFYEASPGSLYDIKRKIDQYEPDILVVDQMANLETKASYTKVEKNEILSAKLRAITKKLGLVTVIVHQASDSAYGKLHVEKNDMYFSNVGVQGQMDVMIGIGMDDAYHAQNRRMYCLTKNKISSDHSNWPVIINPKLSKVYDEGE